MLLSELLASTVVDGSQRSLGPVRDVRLIEVDENPTVGRSRYTIAGLVVGDGFLAGVAHTTGIVEGRAAGPWLLRRATAGAVRCARFIPADRIVSWGPGRVRISGEGHDLPPLREAGGG
jgi:hypothetical protein